MIVDRTKITLPANRQRATVEKSDLLELVDSILKLGLLHPPAFSHLSDDLYQLVAGGRRMAAIDHIANSGKSFLCNGETILPGFVPITLFFSSEKLLRFEAELEENIIRVDLPWPDRVRALAELHRLRQLSNPRQTQKDTAVEVATKTGDTTPENVGKLRHEIQRAYALAEHLDNPIVAKARNEAEAYQLILSSENAKYQSELIRRRTKSVETLLTCTVRPGDATLLMPTMDDGVFDLILSDPPYGLDAGSAGYRARTALHHSYDDSFENSRRLLQSILTEGWRLCKPKANLFLFTDIRHFQFLQEASARMGWTPWRHPVIWQKSLAEGLVPWGRNGFVHTYDIIFFATKGRRGTNGTNVDILSYSRVARNARIYAAEKPLPLLSRLIELTTLPGDVVFDPCAGSGSTLLAAKLLRRHSLGIELDPKVCDLATVRINSGDPHDASLFTEDEGTFTFDPDENLIPDDRSLPRELPPDEPHSLPTPTDRTGVEPQ